VALPVTSSSSSEAAPYPTGSSPAVGVIGTGSAAPSVSLFVGKVSSTSSSAGVATSSPVTSQFTGSASSVRGSWGVLVGVVVAGLVVVL